MKKYLIFIGGLILGIVGSCYATYKLTASQVSFDKINTNLNSNDVQGAIDELAEMKNKVMGEVAEPVIKGDLVPVTIENNGTVKKADTSKKWYDYGSNSVDSSYPWFIRGGRCQFGVLSGQFYFDRYSGGTSSTVSFRITLSIK